MAIETLYSNLAVQYGSRTEPLARTAFEAEQNVNVHNFELVVPPEEPWLACGPDGILKNKDGETLLLEIKFPYSKNASKFTDAPLLRYLQGTESLSLRESHMYSTQNTGVPTCVEAAGCRLFIYTSIDSLTLTVSQNNGFLSNAIPKL